nr:MAG TPA: NlpE N-terminal domain [Caudoviricetes sp.]
MYILLSARSGRPCRVCSRRRLRKIFSAACPGCSGLRLNLTISSNGFPYLKMPFFAFQ